MKLSKFFFLIISSVFLLISCSSSPKILNMIPKDENLVFQSTGKSLKVTNIFGGEESNIFSAPKINNLDFRTALIETLKRSNLFTEIIISNNADYA